MKRPSSKQKKPRREELERALQLAEEENRRLQNLVDLQELRIQSGVKSHLITADIFQTIVNSTDDGIMIEDENGTIIFANDGLVRMLGYSSCGEIMDRSWTDFFTYQTKRKTGAGAETVECMLARRDGTKTPVMVTSSAYQKDGAYTGVLSFIKDIRTRKYIEERELELTERASHVQKMEALVNLASGIVHDFNNTIGVIRGFAETGIEKSGSGAAVEDDLRNIIDATRMAESLVAQLLDFARSGDTRRTVCSVNEIVDEVCNIASRTFPSEITVQCSKTEKKLECFADRTQIVQMLLNLCINARDAMPEGGELLIETDRVHLKGTEFAGDGDNICGECALVRIQDTGHGIPDDIKNRVFEPFFTTKPGDKGSGLGLAQAYGTARKHGGAIRLSSAEGKGTTVEFFLPAKARPATQRQQRKNQSAPAAAPAPRNATLLAIDDNPLMLSLVKNIASLNGIRLHTADTREAGLRTAKKHAADIDVVLVDMRLSGASGQDLCVELKKIDSNFKIILFSGNDPSNVTSGPGSPADAFLKKPFTADKFISTVNSLFE